MDMHGVTRTYSGKGAVDLFNVLEANKAEIETELRKVKGFRSYTLMRTSDGGMSLTICDDKSGTDESAAVARNWVATRAGSTGAAAPAIAEGVVIIHAV
jgi:hypothetical protein